MVKKDNQIIYEMVTLFNANIPALMLKYGILQIDKK